MPKTLTELLNAKSPGDPSHRPAQLAAIPAGSVDLTDERSFGEARALAELLLEDGFDASALEALECKLAAHEPPVSVLVQLGVKLARSRCLALRCAEEEPFVLSVVFAVYKEHERMLGKSEHAAGEAFLQRKDEQLAWLFHGLEGCEYEVLVVDDGCPEGSGKLAERIIASEGLDRFRVLFLEKAIAKGLPVTRPMQSPDASRKGGSILYGMSEAASTQRDRHVVLFTDADLSTDLGQSGVLIPSILGGKRAAIGSRREPSSVVIKGGSRNDRGKLFIYLWKRLLPELGDIIDTQCGFKAFDARIVDKISASSIEKQFAFDIELLLRTELAEPGSIQKVPIAWIDSEALSTTTEFQPYLAMLQKVAAMYRQYLEMAQRSDPWAEFLESLDENDWARLERQIPQPSRRPAPEELGAGELASVQELRTLLTVAPQ